jgi:pimeloyl-ACP methyl ester carboxylesterase
MADDISHVLGVLKKQFAEKKICLIGICSGAKVALYTARSGSHEIENLVVLSCPLLRESSSIKTNVKTIRSMASTYGKRLKDRDTYKRLLDGEVNIKLIAKKIAVPLRAALSKFRKLAFHRVRERPEDYSAFVNFKGEVLSVYGEKDPETEEASGQIMDLLKINKVQSEMVIVKGANHSFYSIHWEQEIIELISRWLKKRVSR